MPAIPPHTPLPVTAAAPPLDRFSQLADAVDDFAIFSLDPAGVITSWSPGCERMKRFRASEAIGHHFEMLYPREARDRGDPGRNLQTAATHGRFRGQGLRQRRGGDLFLADVLIVPIRTNGVLMGYVKLVQDLSEHTMLVQERDLSRTAEQRLKAESEFRERFVLTLTHDLRQPLASALLAAQMMARRAGDAEAIKHKAAALIATLGRVDRMISDLLDVARADAGSALALSYEPCDLRAVVDEVVRELSPEHGGRFSIDADGDIRGVWSHDGLRRVVENLLSNALKYGAPGERITIRLRRHADHVLLSVHNEGEPMSPADQQALFHPFNRTRSAERSGKPGWGLGLALVRGVVEAHGGMVKVESYPGEGTTFTVDLPVDAGLH